MQDVGGVVVEGVGREEAPAFELREANERLVLAALREHALAEHARQEAAQQTALVEHLQAGVLLLDRAMQIRLMNESARALFGVSAGFGARLDDLGVSFETIRGTRLALRDTPFQQMFAGEVFSDREVVLVRSDGGRRRVAVGGSLVRDCSGQVTSAVAVLHDVTELRELEKMREEYIALLSHDLRSPLSGVSLFSSLLERVLLTKGLPVEAGNARRILKNAQHLTALINELLESTRLEAGTRALHKSRVDCRALMAEACEGFSPTEQARVEIESEGSLELFADPCRLKRVLTNLVSNALKYSPADSKVTVTARKSDGELTITVQDAGRGIAPHDRAHIFDKYYRCGNKRTEGTGLGLYIVRLIVESHGGRIALRTGSGKGSTFIVTLPTHL